MPYVYLFVSIVSATKVKRLYHILDYGQQLLSFGGRNGCGICYKKRRNKFRHAPFTQIAVQLKFIWLINTIPTWCIVNHEMGSLACVNPYLDGWGTLPPCYSVPTKRIHSLQILPSVCLSVLAN